MNKRFTDIFICRPVLAIVISLLILVLGIKSLFDLQVRQYPKIDSTLITVTTQYPGASADLVEGFITQQIESSVATSEGVDYIDSQSIDSKSTINIHVKLNYDPNVAFTDVMSKVTQVQNNLPEQAQLPVIKKQSDSATSLMFIAFDSKTMTAEQITDYVTRAVKPKLESVSGVASAEILGGKTFAMRAWLDTRKMAALGVTPNDVTSVLQKNNFQSAAGNVKGYFIQISINASTSAEDVATFENLVIKNDGDTLVRMSDVAKVELGSESYDSSVILNDAQAVFIAINGTPVANPLTVIKDVRALLPEIKAVYPPDLTSNVVYDATTYISASMDEVIVTIFEATLIVILVMYCFLGSLRAVLVPIVTIPLSLIGVAFFMLAMGYSLNLLTLLAMVLAIGLVVDDAIVVVENVHRHLEEGLTPFKAAIKGAREIATAVISMTITLAAVYAPIGFMSGLTGALFTEFAFTLAGSVIVSGVIALTLSPMMCSKVLNAESLSNKFARWIDTFFDKMRAGYEKILTQVFNCRVLIAGMAVAVLAGCFIFYDLTPSELAPVEDQGILLMNGTGPQYANIDYVERNSDYMSKLIEGFPATASTFVVNGMNGINTFFGGMLLKPWGDRVSQFAIQPELQQKLFTITGMQTVGFPMPSLPGGGSGLPIQFVLTSIGSFTELYQAAEKIKDAAQSSGLFLFIQNSLQFNKPQLIMNVDRNLAGNLGINMQDLGNALSGAYGSNYTNWFPMGGKNYKVIPQVQQRFRLNPDDLDNLYVQTASQDLVPISTFTTLQETTVPNIMTHFQQLNSATVQGVLAPMVTSSDALTFLKAQADKVMPRGMTYNYAGELRQYVQEGSGLIVALFLSIIVIYLVLAAQFESFRDPFVILISVPMSICGALICLNMGFNIGSIFRAVVAQAMTINIYTQVGLITLIGLISKHGILIVEFANQLQAQQGLSIREAAIRSACSRLRPILMTTAAMVLGVLPLLIATGAGAQSRFAIGYVIFTGMSIGTCFTLFVVPTMYTFFAKKHQPLPTADEE